jgi:DnaJ-class molecular chaperone
MTKKSAARQILGFLKDCDDMVNLITGSRIKDFVKRGVELYGNDIKKTAEEFLTGATEELAEDNPYRVLGCRSDASDMVIKGKYRQLVRKYHSDTGINPDAKKFQQVVEAYNAILEARRVARRGDGW